MWSYYKWFSGADGKRIGGLYRHDPDTHACQGWLSSIHNWADLPAGNRLEKSLEVPDPAIVAITEAEARARTGPVAAEGRAARKAAISSGQGPSWGRTRANKPPGRGAS
jgi:hypothetical protein